MRPEPEYSICASDRMRLRPPPPPPPPDTGQVGAPPPPPAPQPAPPPPPGGPMNVWPSPPAPGLSQPPQPPTPPVPCSLGGPIPCDPGSPVSLPAPPAPPYWLSLYDDPPPPPPAPTSTGSPPLPSAMALAPPPPAPSCRRGVARPPSPPRAHPDPPARELPAVATHIVSCDPGVSGTSAITIPPAPGAPNRSPVEPDAPRTTASTRVSPAGTVHTYGDPSEVGPRVQEPPDATASQSAASVTSGGTWVGTTAAAIAGVDEPPPGLIGSGATAMSATASRARRPTPPRARAARIDAVNGPTHLPRRAAGRELDRRPLPAVVVLVHRRPLSSGELLPHLSAILPAWCQRSRTCARIWRRRSDGRARLGFHEAVANHFSAAVTDDGDTVPVEPAGPALLPAAGE